MIIMFSYTGYVKCMNLPQVKSYPLLLRQNMHPAINTVKYICCSTCSTAGSFSDTFVASTTCSGFVTHDNCTRVDDARAWYT